MTEFQKARLKLTAWYILIVLILLVISSLAAINAERIAFSKIQEALSDPIQRPRLTALLNTRIGQFEQNFRQKLLLFDVILLVIGSGASYLLSQRTLLPIAKMIKQQEEFAADASHELRTPLTTIGMELEALKRTEKNLPGKYLSVFDSITEEVNRMQDIVEGLLALVRNNPVDKQRDRETFNLSKLTEESFSQMTGLAEEKKLEYKSSIEKDLQITGSPEQLKQVILILLDNAIKYTPAGKLVEVKLANQKSAITLSVSDTGLGIKPADLPHIFERFYRAHNSSTQKGNGLGLSIAKKIIENHGGKIFAKSSDQGSVFIFELPFRS